MMVTKKSPFSGETHTIEINVTVEQLECWQAGSLIQQAMPNVPAHHREFLMTGITPKEWDTTFGESK